MAPTPRFRLSSLQAPDPTNDVVCASGKAARPDLLSYDQMPKWFRHESNKYILSGYRDISGSVHTSLCSLCYLHNESVNIYSHLIPAVFFLLGQWYIHKYWGITVADSLALSVFMMAAVTCLSLSVAYHTFMNHSKGVAQLCLRLDMLGVVIFILGDLVLGTYLTFWCERVLRNIYWSLSVVIGMLAIFVTMHPRFQGAEHRLLRALMFTATGLFGLLPLVHGISIFGLSRMQRKAFPYTLAKAGCLLFGTSIYLARYPESRYPGDFDLCSSHSIFHILVVCAAIVQLAGYLDAFSYAHANLTCRSL